MALERKVLTVSEIDQVAEAWPGSKISPIQLSSGALNMTLDGVVDVGFAVMRMSLEPKIVDRACSDPDQIGFVMVERPQVWCGMNIEPPALLVDHHSLESRSVLAPGFRSLEFFFSSDEWNRAASDSLSRLPRNHPRHRVFPLTRVVADQLRAAVDALVSIAEDGESSNIDDTLEVAARLRIIEKLDAIVSRANDPKRTVARTQYRSALALSALDEIDQTDIRDVSLPTMHSTLGVSRRTLEKAFSSVLGVSPGQYLIAYRLNHLRQSLVDSGGRIIDGVFEAGLKDPSRTAHHYHRLFGELPSHTLERCQQRALATS